MTEKVLYTFTREDPAFEQGYGLFGYHYHILSFEGGTRNLLNVLPDEQTASLEAQLLWSELNFRYDMSGGGDEPEPYHEFVVIHRNFLRLNLEGVIGIKNMDERQTQNAQRSLVVCSEDKHCSVNDYLQRQAMDSTKVAVWSEAAQ